MTRRVILETGFQIKIKICTCKILVISGMRLKPFLFDVSFLYLKSTLHMHMFTKIMQFTKFSIKF